jgi:hypothetical protein
MVAVAALAAASLGNNVVADGLACTPTAPASLTVTIGPGSITQLTAVDSSAYGSLAADTSDDVVKMGINLQATSLTFAAPSISGQSVNLTVSQILSIENLLATRATWQCAGDRAGDGDADGGD